MLVYDKDGNIYSEHNNERKNLRSAVDVLLPHQNNKCFYCNRKVNVNTTSNMDDFPDVDHVIPHSFFRDLEISPDGIWNLVISCKECNRGLNGKFDSPPSYNYFNDLIIRNILFSEEHKHSLKNSILLSLNLQLSETKKIPKQMQYIYNHMNLNIVNGWNPKLIHS